MPWYAHVVIAMLALLLALAVAAILSLIRQRDWLASSANTHAQARYDAERLESDASDRQTRAEERLRFALQDLEKAKADQRDDRDRALGRLRNRLGLVYTADGEYAVPNMDRLWSEDFPDARPLDRDGRVRWSPIGNDQRNGGACYLFKANADAERARIMREDMPDRVDTRIREAKYPDGRVVEFHMDKPETWPPEIRAIGATARAALPPGVALPVVNLEAMRKDMEALRGLPMPIIDQDEIDRRRLEAMQGKQDEDAVGE